MILREALGAVESEDRQSAIALIRQNPAIALACLNASEDNLGLSLRQAGEALELVLETAGNDSLIGQELVRRIAPQRIAELVAVRGDLPSTALLLLPLLHVLATVLTDVCADAFGSRGSGCSQESPCAYSSPKEDPCELQSGHTSADELEEDMDPNGEGSPLFPEGAQVSTLSSKKDLSLFTGFIPWAQKIQERSDYEAFLDLPLGIGSIKVRDWLILGVWASQNCPVSARRVSASVYIELSLDPAESEARLIQLLMTKLRSFHLEALEEAREEVFVELMREMTDAGVHRAGQVSLLATSHDDAF